MFIALFILSIDMFIALFIPSIENKTIHPSVCNVAGFVIVSVTAIVSVMLIAKLFDTHDIPRFFKLG